MLHKIQPVKYPGFAFCWLQLITNSIFMDFLDSPDEQFRAEFRSAYQTLIFDLFRFFGTQLKQGQFASDAVKAFYRGTLRYSTTPSPPDSSSSSCRTSRNSS